MPLQSPTTLDELLLFRLSRILSAGGSRVVRLCEGQLGITWREWRLIATLRPGVSLLSSALADLTQLDRARTSRCLSSLAAKSLIERRPTPGDRRQVQVCLSPTGVQLYDEFFPVVAQLNARLVQGLSAAELAVLDKAMTLLQHAALALQQEAGLPRANRRGGGRAAGKASALTGFLPPR